MFLFDLIVHAMPIYRASQDAGIRLMDPQPLAVWLEAWAQSRGLVD